MSEYKFIVLSDTHIGSDLQRRSESIAAARLSLIVDDINANHGDAEMCVILGDLVQSGTEKEYLQLRALLSKLKPPVRFVLGNHDNRRDFSAVFSDVPRDAHGFCQWTEVAAPGRFLFLDSLENDMICGWYCERRLEWLRTQFESFQNESIYLFVHHPPFPLNFAAMDLYRVFQSEEFRRVIEPHRSRIRHLFFGHVHQFMAGSWMGIPFSSLRSVSHPIPATKAPLPCYGVALVRYDTTSVLFREVHS